MSINKKLNFSWFLNEFYNRTGKKLIICGFITNILSYTVPIFIMNVYDKVIPNGFDSLMYILMFIAISLCIIFYIFSTYADFQVNNELTGILFEAEDQLTKKIPSAKISLNEADYDEYFYLQAKVALSNVINNMPNINVLALIDLPFSLICIFLIFHLGGNLGYISLAVFIIIAIVNILSQKHIKKFVDSMIVFSAKSSTVQSEICQKQIQIRLYNLGSFFFKEHKKYQAFTNGKSYRYLLAQVSNLSTFISMIATIFLVSLGAIYIKNGDLLVGNLVAVSIFSGRLFNTARISKVLYSLYMIKTCFKKLETFSKIKLENNEKSAKIPDIKKISCTKLQFKFLENYPILKDVSFEIKRGESTFIFGNGSSGKTTLFNILAKIRVPQNGSIAINDLDSNNYSEASLRKKVHFCCSEQAFFSGTIADNLFLGKKDIDKNLLDESLDLLGLKPRMLKSNITFNKSLGGQLKLPFSTTNVQLLKICRALISGAEFFVFDDPFVGLDEDNARIVENAMKTFAKKYNVGICVLSKRKALTNFDHNFSLKDGVLV